MKQIMKTRFLPSFLAASMFALACFPDAAQGVQINLTGSTSRSVTVVFDAGSGSFYFVPAVDQFQVTSVIGGTGDSIGMSGNVIASYSIGPVTISGGLQTAPVTGAGMLTINDGLHNLVADLVWGTISTFGTGGTINYASIINLSNISYSGARSDLLELATAGSGTAVVNFQFSEPTSLTQLKQFGGQTTFTSSLTAPGGNIPGPQVPDGGLTLALLGLALAGVETVRRRVHR